MGLASLHMFTSPRHSPILEENAQQSLSSSHSCCFLAQAEQKHWEFLTKTGRAWWYHAAQMFHFSSQTEPPWGALFQVSQWFPFVCGLCPMPTVWLVQTFICIRKTITGAWIGRVDTRSCGPGPWRLDSFSCHFPCRLFSALALKLLSLACCFKDMSLSGQ